MFNIKSYIAIVITAKFKVKHGYFERNLPYHL
jgi:hypothetical protein